MSLNDVPRYPLMFGPEPAASAGIGCRSILGAHDLGENGRTCNSGLAYGGNKVRKLEYLVQDALAQGADTLVSIGGVQSNHTRQVAAVAGTSGPQGRAGTGKLGRLAGPA